MLKIPNWPDVQYEIALRLDDSIPIGLRKDIVRDVVDELNNRGYLHVPKAPCKSAWDRTTRCTYICACGETIKTSEDEVTKCTCPKNVTECRECGAAMAPTKRRYSVCETCFKEMMDVLKGGEI